MFWAAAGTAVRSIVRTIDVMVVMIVFMTFCFSLLQRSPLQPARARHKSVYSLVVSNFNTLVCFAQKLQKNTFVSFIFKILGYQGDFL